MCKSASQAVLGKMQLILHVPHRTPHGAPRLVQLTLFSWSVNTRHAPSRYCSNARVYDHTTTTMHEIEYVSPIEYTHTPPKGAVSAQLLEVALLGVGTVLRLDRDAWSIIK